MRRNVAGLMAQATYLELSKEKPVVFGWITHMGSIMKMESKSRSSVTTR